MWIERLRASNLRNLRELDLEPGPGLCVFVGPNGSGKTSVLEAVHLAATGRSFRSRRRLDLVSRGEETLTVSGVVRSADGGTHQCGVSHGSGGVQLRLDGATPRGAAALARLLPVAVVTPDSQRMLTDGADLRRRLLDWALFHVEQDYGERHQRFRRALKQRTAALREGADRATMASWNRELGEAGEALQSVRATMVDAVLPLIEAQVGALLRREVNVSYRAGWDIARGLMDVLEENTAADRVRGYGDDGPHRADLRFTVDGRAVQHVLSRGESKLFVASVVLAQIAHLSAALGEPPVVIVDDLASELDAESRGRFFAALRESTAQTLVTTVSGDLVDPDGWQQVREFHVEQGRVRRVV